MIIFLKKHIIIKYLNFLLLLNFINLTANFYHASVIDSNLLTNHDPIDTLAEVFLEFIFDMDEETIPDTEVPHEKRKLGDIKLAFIFQQHELHIPQKQALKKLKTIESFILKNRVLDILSPPPQYS